MARYQRNSKRVTWKDDPAARVPVLKPHPYIPAMELPSDVVEKYMCALVPGALFLTVVVLRPDDRFSSGYQRHDHMYLYHDPYAWGGSAAYPAGSMAIYAGQERVEELDRTRDKIRVARHTFIVGGVRYLTANLNDFVPV